MSTTAFTTIIFTMQTVGLAAADSYGTLLQTEYPAVSEFLHVVQSLVNPDRETPEKCLFAPSLLSKFIVEAVLPPVSALGILALISVPWYCCGCSCGLRACCNAKRACFDRLRGRQQRRKLKVRWAGEPVLDGTFALITQARASVPAGTRRSISLAGHDSARVWLPRSSVGAPNPDHYTSNSKVELRRLLRGCNVPMTGEEDQDELRRMLRFATACDDNLFDAEKMPEKLQVIRYTISSLVKIIEAVWRC